VVNAAEFGVVEPMAGGAAKSEVKAMVPLASGAVSVRVVPVVRPSTSKATFLVGSAEPTTRNISSAGSLADAPISAGVKTTSLKTPTTASFGTMMSFSAMLF
jgi:hypothetical protein